MQDREFSLIQLLLIQQLRPGHWQSICEDMDFSPQGGGTSGQNIFQFGTMAPKPRDSKEASGYLKSHCSLWKGGLRRFLKRSAGFPGVRDSLQAQEEGQVWSRPHPPSWRPELKQEGRGKMAEPRGGLRTRIGDLGLLWRFTQVR